MHETIALLPALLFLAALLLLDSFKLVRPATVGAAVLYGALAASACGALHEWMLGATSISLPTFTRYVSPLTEEAAKALFIALPPLAAGRIGFLVDAAVLGFAVGTGFAIVENMLYLRDIGQAPLLLWIARGLGTAILHGATTAIAAMLAKAVTERPAERGSARHPARVARRGDDPLRVPTTCSSRHWSPRRCC